MSTLLTYQDIADTLIDYSGANPQAFWDRQSKRAILGALDELSQSHHWSYYYAHRFITTSAQQDILEWEYVHTGGAYERLVTLTGAETWPSWARDGILRLANVSYDIAARKSSTEITLDINSNPGEDVTQNDLGSGTIYRDAYILPADCWTVDELYPEDLGPIGCIEFVHPREWLMRTRFNNMSDTYPAIFTIMGSADYQGAMELRLDPHPDSETTLAFIYSRRPRPIVILNEHRGTVTNTTNATTVTGTDTVFTEAMIGSVIRLGDDATEEPTGREGANPATVERVITGYTSATEITVDEAIADENATGVKYVISDPVDIDVQLMQRALLRCAENQMGKLLRLEDRTALDAEWMQALRLAREADSRSTQERAVGNRRGYSRFDHPTVAQDID